MGLTALLQQVTERLNLQNESGIIIARSELETQARRGAGTLSGFADPAAPFASPSSTGHLATIEQVGADNLVGVLQEGTSHTATIYQRGEGNTTFLKQYGSFNTLYADFTGNDNYLDLTQDGTNLEYEVIWDAAAQGAPYNNTYVQTGTNNRITEIGVGGVPLKIEQHGTHMQMTIRHN